MKIPPMNLKLYNDMFKDDILERMKTILDQNSFILGPEVKELEANFKETYNVPFSIGVNSGTDALLLALKALNIGPGDEVITVPFTFIATVDVIIRLGATPVFIDIEADTFNMDVSQLEAAITDKTKAIVPVHLYGLAANMTDIMAIAEKHELAVIEDAAQAQGAKWDGKFVGSFGDFAAFSFYPTKNLGGIGDGGMILSTLETEAGDVVKMRDHGRSEGYTFPLIGYNSRLSSFQAAGLNVKMKHLPEMLAARKKIAAIYDEGLSDVAQIQCPVVPEKAEHSYNQYSILAENRDELRAFLSEQGVGTMLYYPGPLHLQDCLQHLGYKEGSFPVSEKTCEKVLSLPMFFGLKDSEQSYIIEKIKEFYKG